MAPDRNSSPDQLPQSISLARQATIRQRPHLIPNIPHYELALRLGMRRGELIGLQWTDIDYTTKTLTIRRTLQRLHGQGLQVMPTKTRSSDWRIPLSDPCIEALRIHKHNQAAQRERTRRFWHDSGYIFTTTIGTPHRPAETHHGHQSPL